LGGPGLLESIYEEALTFELELRGIAVERQVPIQVKYKRHTITRPLVLDLLIEKKIIIEVKSVEQFNPIHASQLLTYLRLSQRALGVLINFGETRVKDGFHRVVNGFPEA